MKKEIILLSVLCIIILYVFTIHKIEEMTNSSDTTETPGTTEQIKEAVKQIYLADVESIRNLSNVASKLQTDGLILPGHMNIEGKLNIGSNINAKYFPDWLRLSVDSNTTDTAIRLKTKTDDTKNIHLVNRDGSFRISNKSGDIFGVNPDGHLYNIHTGDHVYNFVGRGVNPYITISREGEKSWYIQNANNDGINKIFRIGFDSLNNDGAKLDIHKDGNAFFAGNITIPGRLSAKDITIPGNLTANDVITNKNKARYIRVGNMKSIDIINRNTGVKSTNSDSPLAVKNYWTLIEIRVLDKNGVNLAELKDVKQNQGNPTNNTIPTNITNGKIFPDSSKPSKDNYLDGYHGGTGTHQLEIDLGNEYDIDAIELYNRYIAGKDENKSSPTYDIDIEARMNGTIVELINGNKDIINRTIHTGLWHRTYSKEYIL